MKTILITGINGYLGSNLAKALSPSFNIIGMEHNLKDLFRVKHLNYKIYPGGAGVPNELFTDQAIDCIIHTATFYGRDNETTDKMISANLVVPLDLLNQAIAHKCKLFINTDTVLNRFVNNYSLTKRHFQEWLFIRSSEIKVINMQLEHFYGAGASKTNFVTNMNNQMKMNVSSIDLTTGEQKRDFVYIDDVVSAYRTVIDGDSLIQNKYSEFHIKTNELITIKDLVIAIKKMTGSVTKLNFGAIPQRAGDLEQMVNTSNSLSVLGWQPQFDIYTGLEHTIKGTLILPEK